MLFVREHPGAITFSVALHAVIGAALMLGFDFLPGPRTPPRQTVIQATIVDQAAIDREMQRIAEAERAEVARREREEREQREAADAARREREREAEQLRVQREKAAAEEREREAAAERERQRLAEVQRQREAEERRQAEAERQRRAEDERRQAEARKQAELEAELTRALAAEEERRSAEEAGLLDEYIRAIENQIKRNWIRPPTARPGLECVINVAQIPSGDVVGRVSFGACNGDEAVKRSIEAAVIKASPLPRPQVPSLFQRNLVITFAPDV